jgi:hypothetical protein
MKPLNMQYLRTCTYFRPLRFKYFPEHYFQILVTYVNHGLVFKCRCLYLHVKVTKQQLGTYIYISSGPRDFLKYQQTSPLQQDKYIIPLETRLTCHLCSSLKVTQYVSQPRKIKCKYIP